MPQLCRKASRMTKGDHIEPPPLRSKVNEAQGNVTTYGRCGTCRRAEGTIMTVTFYTFSYAGEDP